MLPPQKELRKPDLKYSESIGKTISFFWKNNKCSSALCYDGMGTFTRQRAHKMNFEGILPLSYTRSL
jgi:hypothetical protein